MEILNEDKEKLNEFFWNVLQEAEEYPINVKELFAAANVELSKKSEFTTFTNAGKLYTEMDMRSMFIEGAHWLAEKLNLKKDKQ